MGATLALFMRGCLADWGFLMTLMPRFYTVIFAFRRFFSISFRLYITSIFLPMPRPVALGAAPALDVPAASWVLVSYAPEPLWSGYLEAAAAATALDA